MCFRIGVTIFELYIWLNISLTYFRRLCFIALLRYHSKIKFLTIQFISENLLLKMKKKCI